MTHWRPRAAYRLVLILTIALLVPALAGAAPARPPSPFFTERAVTFVNGTVELKGTLLVPTSPGPHPVVVFLHGSGPHPRTGAKPYAEEFAKLGVAGLVFDKRGSGESGGSWTESSLDDLAGDALAAVAFVKSQPNVDGSKIGFWGVSQAGWVTPLAASRSADVGFMILISGGGASPRDSEQFSYENAFKEAGLSASETAEADSVMDAYFRYLATGEGRAGLASRLESAKSSRWYPAMPLDRILPSEGNRSNWSWVATWDPAASLERIKCPVLLMFGDRDTSHPTPLSVTKWKEGLKKAGNNDATVMVFPGAGHGIRMREGYSGSGRAPFANGYAEAMVGWLMLHVVARAN
ncbi:MAG: alpha/beta hydrolase family protein [Candidatus Eiseniibacteriota bacterium]